MLAMDHTPIEELLSELEETDPADAPPIAEEIGDRLSVEIDEDDDGAEPAPSA